MSRPEWLDRAACTTIGEAPFYPEDGAHPTAALQICHACPVMHECLQDAIDTGDLDFGIRGGLTPRQRRRALTQQNKEKALREAQAQTQARDEARRLAQAVRSTA